MDIVPAGDFETYILPDIFNKLWVNKMLVKTKNYVYFGDTGGKECKVNMKRIIKLVIVMTLCMVMIGCQRKEKNVYTETYTLKYFYVLIFYLI